MQLCTKYVDEALKPMQIAMNNKLSPAQPSSAQLAQPAQPAQLTQLAQRIRIYCYLHGF